MPKYYVAGIPFDSENALMHYGVKGMKWDQHIFGPDANTKYINWMDVGKMASSKGPSQFTDTGSGGKNPIVSTRNGSQQKGPGLVRSALDKGAQLRYQANQAANQAGKAIGSAAGQALKAGSNFLTGNQAQKDLSNAQRSYNFNKKQLVNNARLYNQGISDIRNGMDQTADANRRWYANHDPELYDAIDRDWDKGRQLQQTGREKAETSRNRANDVMKSFLNAKSNRDNAQKSLDSTLPSIANRASEGAKGFINSAGKWVSNAAGDVGKAASDAAGWLGDRAGDVEKAATNAWNGVTGAVGDAGQWIGDRAGDVAGAASQAGQWIGDRAGDVAGAATNAWKGVTGAANSVGDWVGDRASDVGRAVSGATGDAGKWIGNAAGDAGRWISGAANDVGKAASDAAGWVGDRAGDVGRTATNAWNGVSDAASKAGNWIGDRAQDVGNFVSEMANPHVQIDGDRLMDNYRNYLNEHPENPQSPAHEEWLKEQIRNDPQLREYYEQNIKERTIPEQTIKEQIIPEQTIPEQTIPEQRITEYGPRSTPRDPRLNDAQQKQVDYWDGVIQKRIDDFDNYYNGIVSDPRWQNYTRQDVMDDLLRQQDYWRNRAYRENLQHSELDNRPDGVSDAFWKQYVADGGTREQYERDWR